jgi:type IV pilus assembly protein PilW
MKSFLNYNKNFPHSAPKGFRPGLTLVELMIAIALALIVSIVGFNIYRINADQYLRVDSYILQQQNLRAAFYLMARDLRMAGNGLFVLGPKVKMVQAYVPSQPIIKDSLPTISTTPGWFMNTDTSERGFRAIFGSDGGTANPDSVTIFRTEVEYPAPLGVVKTYTSSAHKLEFFDDIRSNTVVKDDIIALVNDTNALLLQVDDVSNSSLTYLASGRFTAPKGPADPDISFSVEGATVYNLRDVTLVTYYIDQVNNRLMAAHHDQKYTSFDNATDRSIVVADNIEDMQIYYYLDNESVDLSNITSDNPISSSRLQNHSIKALALGLTSRSGYGKGTNIKKRPKLFNRTAGTNLDNNRRNSLSELIYLRNFQQ